MSLFADLPTPLLINGFQIHIGYLNPKKQMAIVEDIRAVVRAAPLMQPITPSGRKMSVKMSAAGRLGWITDHKGYRYSATHPNGQAWPSIPQSVLSVWEDLVGADRLPDCCLINHYSAEARMGLHQDRDEGDFSWPVLSISLGDEGLFRMGGVNRKDPTKSHWLQSGDVVVMGGQARLAFHGVDRIKPGTSTLLEKPGRINLTLRVVEQS
ncbi:MAG: alpha-ketoglutarate-dependent dioxygenase AlkB [Pseudomonadota bacterium]